MFMMFGRVIERKIVRINDDDEINTCVFVYMNNVICLPLMKILETLLKTVIAFHLGELPVYYH